MDNEIKILSDKLDKFIEETRRSFGDINESLNTFEKKLEDNYREIGKMKDEFYLLKGNIDKQTKTFKRGTNELQESINGNTKVIIKETDKPKKRWYQVWVKNKP